MMKRLAFLFFGAALFACGGGGGGGGGTSTPASPSTGLCSSAVTVSSTGTVSGTAYYEDRTYDSAGFTGTACKPIRYATVEIVNGSGTATASTTTAADGTFSVAPGATGTLYVRVTATAASPYSAAVKDDRDSSTYAVTSSTFTLASGQGAAVVLAAAKEDVGQAFNIFDQLIKAQGVVRGIAGGNPPLITAYWYSGTTAGTYYTQPSSGKHDIYILGKSTDSDAYDDSVILHEMGHYVAGAYSKDDSPGGSHSLTGHYDLRLTWSEGWATFFSSLAKAIGGESSPALYVDTNGNSGTGSSTLLFTFDLDTPSYTTYAIGADNEMAVGNVLWHIYAGPADTTHLGLGATDIWNIFSQDLKNYTAGKVTFETFYDKWAAPAAARQSISKLLTDRSIKYSADTYESDNDSSSARTLAAGTTETHTFFKSGTTASGDADWFAISVTNGTAYTFTISSPYPSTVSTTALGDGADTLLTLYDSNGTTQLKQNDDINSSTRASQISWTANATKTVYLKCETYRPLVSGDVSYVSTTSYPAAVVNYGYYNISFTSQ